MDLYIRYKKVHRKQLYFIAFSKPIKSQSFISSKWEKSTEMLNSLFIKEFDWIKEPDEYFDIEQEINAVKKMN